MVIIEVVLTASLAGAKSNWPPSQALPYLPYSFTPFCVSRRTIASRWLGQGSQVGQETLLQGRLLCCRKNSKGFLSLFILFILPFPEAFVFRSCRLCVANACDACGVSSIE